MNISCCLSYLRECAYSPEEELGVGARLVTRSFSPAFIGAVSASLCALRAIYTGGTPSEVIVSAVTGGGGTLVASLVVEQFSFCLNTIPSGNDLVNNQWV